MPYKKYVLVSVIVLLALSSCQLPYPDQTSATTPNPTSLFTTPLSAGNDQMTALQGQATQTAIALTAGAGGGPTATPSSTPINPVTATSTPIIVGGATLTPSVTPIVVGGSTLTPSVTPNAPPVVTTRPQTYTLQKGEFPYCIARRFDLNPDTLLSMNPKIANIPDNQIPSGTVLQIPQTGSWPGNRALRPHPTTYTVTSSDETFYSIACLFGDVDPARIAQANPTYSLGSVLPVGKTINIP